MTPSIVKLIDAALKKESELIDSAFPSTLYHAKPFIMDDVEDFCAELVSSFLEKRSFPTNQIFMPAEKIVLEFSGSSLPYKRKTEKRKFIVVEGNVGEFLPEMRIYIASLEKFGRTRTATFFDLGKIATSKIETVLDEGSVGLDFYQPNFDSHLIKHIGPEMRRQGTGSDVAALRINGLAFNTILTSLAMISIINTPKHFGQSASVFLKKRPDAPVGSFPYKGWTNVYLKTHENGVLSSDKRTYLTRKKCKHFVRSFTRVRNGNLEIVSPHWRGDASIGIKNSRYVVQ